MRGQHGQAEEEISFLEAAGVAQNRLDLLASEKKHSSIPQSTVLLRTRDRSVYAGYRWQIAG